MALFEAIRSFCDVERSSAQVFPSDKKPWIAAGLSDATDS